MNENKTPQAPLPHLESLVGFKCCPACQKWKPANSRYFYRNKTTSDGLDCWCRECRIPYNQSYHKEYDSVYHTNKENRKRINEQKKERNKKRRLENPEYYKELYNRQKENHTKPCIACGNPVASLRTTYCRGCGSRIGSGKDPKEYIELQRQGKKRCTICNQILPLSEESFYKNAVTRDGYHYWCIPCVKEIGKRYRLGGQIYKQNYDAQKHGLVGDFTVEQWKATLMIFDYRCAYCGQGNGKLAQEHIIPVNEGGGTTWGNIIPACYSCNNSKRGKHWVKWMIAKGFDVDTLREKLRELERLENYYKDQHSDS